LIQLARSFTSILNTINIMPTILGTDRGKNQALLTIGVNSETIGLSIATNFTMSSNEIRALAVYR